MRATCAKTSSNAADDALWQAIELAARARDVRRVRALLDVAEPFSAPILELAGRVKTGRPQG